MATSGGEDGAPTLQIAPMVDIVFVLLLFFMVTAAFQPKEGELPTTIPTPKPLEGVAVVAIEIILDDEGAVYLNGFRVCAAEDSIRPLQEKLQLFASLSSHRDPVVVNPSPFSRHERVMQVLASLQEAKFHQIAFAPN